ncbi:hypothetical protein ACFL6D_02685 [Spirochaetota bacterium]
MQEYSVYLKIFSACVIIDTIFILIVCFIIIGIAIAVYRFMKKITGPLAENIDRISTNVEVISRKAVTEADNVKDTIDTVNVTVRNTADLYNNEIFPALVRFSALMKILFKIFSKDNAKTK